METGQGVRTGAETGQGVGTGPGHGGISCVLQTQFSSFFYVMGKTLSGKLSCTLHILFEFYSILLQGAICLTDHRGQCGVPASVLIT